MLTLEDATGCVVESSYWDEVIEIGWGRKEERERGECLISDSILSLIKLMALSQPDWWSAASLRSGRNIKYKLETFDECQEELENFVFQYILDL